MIKDYKDRIIDFLECNGCEDVELGYETEEGVAISYVIAETEAYIEPFQYCEIFIKKIKELPEALRKTAEDFDMNAKVCEIVILKDGKCDVISLLQSVREIRDRMFDLAKASEEFVEGVLQNELQKADKLIASIYEEYRELNEDEDEYVWTESTNMERTFNTNYVNRFIDWLSEYQYNDEICFHLSNGETEDNLHRVIEELSNGTMKMKDLDGCGIQCLRRSSGQWKQQVMECTFKFKEI